MDTYRVAGVHMGPCGILQEQCRPCLTGFISCKGVGCMCIVGDGYSEATVRVKAVGGPWWGCSEALPSLGNCKLRIRGPLSRASNIAAGGAGAGTEGGLAGRVRAWLRGRGAKSDAIAVRGVTPAMIEEAAAATEGFSGRELAKMVASMQVRGF